MKKHHKTKQRRNAAPPAAATRRRRNASRRRRNAFAVTRTADDVITVTRAPPPELRTMAAAAVGSVGSALLSGIAVNQSIVRPETAALVLTAIGAGGAYLTAGDVRVACAGIAAVGAGQYAITKLGRAALKGKPDSRSQSTPEQRAQAPAQLPAAPPPTAQKPRSASDGGVLIDMIRDVAHDYESIERNDWNDVTSEFVPRDAAGDERDWDDGDPRNYVELELDDVA